MTFRKAFLRTDYSRSNSVLAVMAVLSQSPQLSVSDVITGVYEATGLLLKPNNAAGILDRLVDAGHSTKTKRGKKGSPRTYSLTKAGIHDFEVYKEQGIDMGLYLAGLPSLGFPREERKNSDPPKNVAVVTKLHPDIDLPDQTNKLSNSKGSKQPSVKSTGRKAVIAEN